MLSCFILLIFWQGYGVSKGEKDKVVKFSFQGHPAELKHGSVVIAAITSCTNTSNPSVMLGAGLVGKKACELGLEVSLKSQQHLNVTFSRKVGCKLSPLKELNVLTVILIILIWCFHVLLYQVKPWIKSCSWLEGSYQISYPEVCHIYLLICHQLHIYFY